MKSVTTNLQEQLSNVQSSAGIIKLSAGLLTVTHCGQEHIVDSNTSQQMLANG